MRSDRRLRTERGQSLVELALMMPFLILVLLGIVDLGRVFNAYIAITNASREGAIYGSSWPPVGDPALEQNIRDRVMRELEPTISIDQSLIDISAVGYEAGTPVTVTVRYPFSAVSFLIQGLFPTTPFSLTSTTVLMVRE